MARSTKFHSDDHEEDGATANDHHNPPMVPAENLDNVYVVNDAVPAGEGQPLLFQGAASAPVEPQEPDLLAQDTGNSNCTGVQEDAVVPDVVSEEEEREKARSMGAGIATGILTSLLVGPFFGALLGFGAAYATKKEGALGDSARAMGDVALTASAKAKEIDQKHHVVERSKHAAGRAWEKAKEMDQKHQILTKTKDFCIFFKEFCQRHRVVERGVQGAEHAANWAGEQFCKVAANQQAIDAEGSNNNASARAVP